MNQKEGELEKEIDEGLYRGSGDLNEIRRYNELIRKQGIEVSDFPSRTDPMVNFLNSGIFY